MMNVLFNAFKRSGTVLGSRYWQVALLFLALIMYSTTGYMYFEYAGNPDLQWSDATWWSVVTMTTVGYGDFFPKTLGGRMFVGIPTMFLGIGLLGYILSMAGAQMLETKALEVKGMKNMTCEDHIIICGFGSPERLRKLIGELRSDRATKRCDIVIIDHEIEELPGEFRADKVHFVSGDPARESVLQKANLIHARSAIIQANLNEPETTDDRNLKVALAIECFNPAVFSVAECLNPENEPYFKRANCDSVVCISSMSEQMLIQEMQDPGVANIVSQLTSNGDGKQIYIVDIATSFDDFRGARVATDKNGTVLIGIQRGNKNHLLPDQDFKIQEKDRLILIAAERPSPK